MTRVSQRLDRIDASFDDPNLVANAGLLLVATLSQRLDLEAMIDANIVRRVLASLNVAFGSRRSRGRSR